MYKDVPEQLVCRRPLLGLHKDAFEELPAVVRHVGGQHGVRGLRGDLEDGRHGLKLRPRRSLRQHLHDGAADTPEGNKTSVKSFTRKEGGVVLFFLLFALTGSKFCLWPESAGNALSFHLPLTRAAH